LPQRPYFASCHGVTLEGKGAEDNIDVDL
jgi:hypothetical protein